MSFVWTYYNAFYVPMELKLVLFSPLQIDRYWNGIRKSEWDILAKKLLFSSITSKHLNGMILKFSSYIFSDSDLLKKKPL